MAIVHESCRKFTTSFLTRHGHLKPNHQCSGLITWYIDDKETGNAGYFVDTTQYKVTLKYRYMATGADIVQDIKLKTVPSNLGKGDVWYFICPFTGDMVRTLYLIGSSTLFASRKAYNRPILYRSQTSSHMDRWNDRYWKLEKQIDALHGKGFTPYYAGKKTSTARRLEKLIAKRNEADEKRWSIECMPASIRKYYYLAMSQY